MNQPLAAWYVYAAAYCYALFFGELVALVTEYMYDLTEIPRVTRYKWQPPVVGIVERTLFLSSLIAGHGSFIALWLTLKVTVQYKRWSGDDRSLQVEDADRVLVGRTLFMDSLIGNGLSILYAGVGYGIIQWSISGPKQLAVIVPVALVLGTVALRFWLWLDPLTQLKGIIKKCRQ